MNDAPRHDLEPSPPARDDRISILAAISLPLSAFSAPCVGPGFIPLHTLNSLEPALREQVQFYGMPVAALIVAAAAIVDVKQTRKRGLSNAVAALAMAMFWLVLTFLFRTFVGVPFPAMG